MSAVLAIVTSPTFWFLVLLLAVAVVGATSQDRNARSHDPEDTP